MTVKISKLDGTYTGAANHTEVIVKLAQQACKQKAESVAALTDNSGGDATPTADAVQFIGTFANEANSGTSLAQKAATETALGKTKDAIKELSVKANAYAALLGITQLTDNGGGASADGTIAAQDTSVTAATTGAQATETNANFALINDAFHEVAQIVNKIATATGVAQLNIGTGFASKNGTIAAITVTVGTAADPGVSKAAMDAALVKCADNIAYIAAKLNAFSADAAVGVTVV